MADPQLLTARRWALALTLLSLAAVPRAASAWGNELAHEALADAAMVRANADQKLDIYLEELGFEDGMSSELALFLDFDGLGPVQAEFASGRFERILSNTLLADDPAPPNAFLYEASPHEVDPFRFSVQHLVRAGVFAEDNPNPRARHHFHDPVYVHDESTGDRGLDDAGRLPTRLDEIASEFVAFLRGGEWERFRHAWRAYRDDLSLDDIGNFHLEGRSARDRALNLPVADPPSAEAPRNLFALPDAERYLFRAVTGSTSEEREGATALHFLAFGHALHLLQDQTSPGHVRNDFDIEHVAAAFWFLRPLFGMPMLGTNLETAADSEPAVRLIQNLASSPYLLASRPQEFLFAFGGPAANYAAGQDGFDPSGAELSAFWDHGSPEGTPASLRGLSERTNANFLSAGSISNEPPFGYPSPLIPDGCDVRLPRRDIEGRPRLDLATGEVLQGPFVSSGLVPHLAACMYHAREIQGAGGLILVEELLTNIDTSVQRDYMELLFALAVDYTQKFVETYFAPRIEVIPIGEGRFRIHNLTSWPFQFSGDGIQVFYDDEGDERGEAVVDCEDGEVTLGPEGSDSAVSTISCSLTGPLLGGTPKNRGDFIVVVRGKLGERGEVGAASQYDSGDEDFVVGFDHIRSTLLYDSVAGSSGGDADQVDVYAVEIDPTTEVGEKSPRPKNLTGALRESLGNAALDFAAPVALAGQPKVALRADLEGVGGGFTDVAADLGAYIWEPHAAATGAPALTPVPSSRISGVVPRPMLLSSWTPDGETLFYVDNQRDDEDESYPYQSLNRYDVASGASKKFVVKAGFSSSHEADVNIQTLDQDEEIVVCEGVEQVSAVSETTVFVTSKCRKDRIDIVDTDNNGDGEDDRIREFVEEKSILFRMDVIESTDEPGKLDGVRTHRFSAGGSDSCSEDCWEYESTAYSPVVSPDGERVAFLTDPPQNDEDPPRDRPDMDIGQRLHVASVSGLGMRTVVSSDAPRIMTPSWSPDGVWLAFGIAEGNADDLFSSLGPRDLYSAHADETGAEPTRLTRGGDFARLHSWYKPGLELPEN